MKRARQESARLYDALGRRNGWITRRARSEGKDPARVFAGLKAAATRARRQEHLARVHGERARVKTESRLTPAQKAARTRDANRIERAQPREGGYTLEREPADYGEPDEPREEMSLDDIWDNYGEDYDYDDYDVETSPDYEETTA